MSARASEPGVYDGKQVIQERNASNVPTVSFTRGTDLSGSLEGAGGIGGLLARSAGYSGGNWTDHVFYHADGNGNITYLVSSTRTLAASYRYDPFGNLISKSGTLADANLYRFSSKELHVNSGLYYYLYRFYSPNLQRWPNRDPIGERGGVNLYTFGFNSPINVVDFLGLEPGDIGTPRPGTEGRGQNCMGHALCDSGKWEQGDTRTKDNPWPEEKYLKDKGCREVKCSESCDSAKKEQKVKLYEWKNEDQFHIVRQNGDKWSGKIGAGPIYDFPDPDKHTSEAYKIKPEDWKATCWCCPCKK
jgi:RHS repeat-associated protein